MLRRSYFDDSERTSEHHAQTARLRLSRASRTCPSCKRPGCLTTYEASRGYQCADCTARDEGTGW